MLLFFELSDTVLSLPYILSNFIHQDVNSPHQFFSLNSFTLWFFFLNFRIKFVLRNELGLQSFDLIWFLLVIWFQLIYFFLQTFNLQLLHLSQRIILFASIMILAAITFLNILHDFRSSWMIFLLTLAFNRINNFLFFYHSSYHLSINFLFL